MIYVRTYVRLYTHTHSHTHLCVWLAEDDDSGGHYVSQQECGNRLPLTIFQLPSRCAASTIFTHTHTRVHRGIYSGHIIDSWLVRVAFLLSCCVVSFCIFFFASYDFMICLSASFWTTREISFFSSVWDLGPLLLLNCSCLC